MKLWVSSIAIVILLGGCFQSENNESNKQNSIENEKNINFIKNGAMDFDKTLTVGQAFDNWKYCSNKKWENFTTDNGRKVIQFECEYQQPLKFIELLQKSKKLSNEYFDYLNIRNIKLQVQWTLNIDNTFQLHNITEIVSWENGFVLNQNIDNLFLKKIYDNKNYFENNYIDNQKIKYYSNKFYEKHKVEIDKKRNIKQNILDKKAIEEEYIQDVKKYFKDKDILTSIKQVTTIDELYKKIKNEKNKDTYILQNLIFDMMSFNTKSIKYLPASKRIIDLIIQDTNLKSKENIFTFFIFMNMNPEWADKASVIQDKYLNQIINYMIQYPKIVNLMKTNALDSKRNIFSFYMLFDEVGSKKTIKTYENMIKKGIDPTISELSNFETVDNIKNTKLYEKLIVLKNSYVNKYANEIIENQYSIWNDLDKKTTKKIIIKYKSTVKDYFDFMITSKLNYNVKNKWKHSYMTDKSKVISKKAINELFELIKPKFIDHNITVKIENK